MHVMVDLDSVYEKQPFRLIYDEILAAAQVKPVLHAEDVYVHLASKPDVMQAVAHLTPQELYELDILFFNQGGRFLMQDFQRPYETSLLPMQGHVWRVVRTALFTFEAEAVDPYGHEFV